jgi:hypothetical protein
MDILTGQWACRWDQQGIYFGKRQHCGMVEL